MSLTGNVQRKHAEPVQHINRAAAPLVQRAQQRRQLRADDCLERRHERRREDVPNAPHVLSVLCLVGHPRQSLARDLVDGRLRKGLRRHRCRRASLLQLQLQLLLVLGIGGVGSSRRA